MVHASYKSNTDIYEVRMITTEDMIDTDMRSVSETIQDTDPIVYRENMVESITQSLAYDIWKNGTRVGFVYNRVDGYRYLGCSINIWDHIGMLLAMKTMFEICDKHKIEFAPHTGNLKWFKSMVQGAKLFEYNNGGTCIPILKRDVEANGVRMFKYLGIEKL